jgi:opacity protein-like surface antigen
MFKKIALILVLFTCISFAQKDHDPFMYSGSKAVLFSFSGLSNLGANNFDGGAGFKFFLTPPMALRFGVQVNASGTTTPANTTAARPVGIDGSTTSTTFGADAALEIHLTTTRCTPYFGGGIGFSMSTNERKLVAGPDVAGTTLYQDTYKNESGAGTSINFFALMGVEYFIVDAVSLAAEYRLGYSLLSPKDEEHSNSAPGSVTVTTKGTSFHSLYLNSTGVLTLAVYF